MFVKNRLFGKKKKTFCQNRHFGKTNIFCQKYTFGGQKLLLVEAKIGVFWTMPKKLELSSK